MYTAFLPNLCIILSKQLSFPKQHKRRYIFLSGHTPQAELIFRYRTWSCNLTELAATFFAFFSNWNQTASSSEADPLYLMTVTSTCFVSQGLPSAAVSFVTVMPCLDHQLADWCDTHGIQFPEPSSVHSGCSKNMKMQSSEVQTHQKEQNTKKPQANPISTYYSQSFTKLIQHTWPLCKSKRIQTVFL